MPPGTVCVTILRRPARHVQSLFSYYNQYCPAFRRVPSASLEAFLRAPRPTTARAALRHVRAQHPGLRPGRGDNEGAAFDARLPGRGLIRQVEEVFSLVMIAECFDGCCVLLRRLHSLGPGRRAPTPGSNSVAPASAAPCRRSPRRSREAARAWNALDAGLTTTSTPPSGAMARVPAAPASEREAPVRRGPRAPAAGAAGDEPLLRPAAQTPSSCSRGSPAARWTSWAHDLPSGRRKVQPKPASSWPCLRCSTQATCCASRSAGGMRLRPEPVLDNPPPRPIRALRPGH